MIKKPPSFSGTVDVDGNAAPASAAVHTPEATAAAHASAGIADSNLDGSVNDELDYADELGPDHDLTAPTPKKSSALFTYGLPVAMFAGIGLLAYNQMNHTQKVSQEARVIVPIPATLNSQYSSSLKASDKPLPASPPASPAVDAAAPPVAVPATPASNDRSLPYVGPTGPITTDSTNATPSGGNTPSSPPQTSADATTAAPAAGVGMGAPADVSNQPASSGSQDSRIADLSTKLDALQATVTTINQKIVDPAQLQTMQTKLDQLQTQVNQMMGSLAAVQGDAASSAPPAPKHPASRKIVNSKGAALHLQGANENSWILRSATPGMALISRPGSNDFRSVAIGDTVDGLGRIDSIEQNSGRWSVHGTNGSIGQ